MSEPVIDRAIITPGHDGQAELLVQVRYSNGALGNVTLNAHCADKLMRDCNAESVDALTGQPWQKILNVLK